MSDTASISSVNRFVQYIDGATNDSSFNRFFIYNELREHLVTHGVSSEVLWRLTRAAIDLSALSAVNGDENDKKRFIGEALEWGQQAVNLDNENPDCHQWYAVAIDAYVSEYCSNSKERQLKANAFLNHINIALRAKPNDAYLHHIYGIWFYKWANISWFKKTIAALFNWRLPKGSFDTAIEELGTAFQINPGWKVNALYLAKSFIAKKKFAEALNIIQTSLKEENELCNELNEEVEMSAQHQMELLLLKYKPSDEDDT